jgi:hypothetical protein
LPRPAAGILFTTLVLTSVSLAGVSGSPLSACSRLLSSHKWCGVTATGVAQPIMVFAGPVLFLPDVYATGAAGPLFAIAGGIVEKFIFFMAGPF